MGGHGLPDFNDEAWNAERQRLEGEVFLAINRLRAHTQADAFLLPGKVNPHKVVCVGEPQQIVALCNGHMMQEGAKTREKH